MTTSLSRRGRAFSLIELLVVVSMIVILIALLMPGLGNVRGSARSTICGNNLHQLAMAYGRRDVDVKSSTVERVVGFGWPGRLAPYLSSSEAFICPEGTGSSDSAIEKYVLQVFSGATHIYDMELAPGPLTFYVDRNTTDTYIIQEIDPDLTPGEIAGIPANAYRLYFEDLRPGGGDRDFRDVVLEITETSGGTQIKYVQDAAGYTFNLVDGNGKVIWYNMDNGGTTKPGTTSTVDGGTASYGMNEAVGQFFKSGRNPIMLMDYQQSVVNWGMGIDVDVWNDWVKPDTGEFEFARHKGKVNVLFRDGGVQPAQDPNLFDPVLSTNVDRYWRALDP